MGRTKGSGQGSIYKYENGWRGQITLNGHRFSATGKTKRDVILKLEKIKQSNYQQQFNKERKHVTTDNYIHYWLEHRIQPKVTTESYERLKANFEYHIIPILGQVELRDLTKPMLEEMYATVFQKKGKDGRKYKQQDYSHSTVNALSIQFKKCLYYAVEEGIIAKNPHEGVELHKLRPPKKVFAYTSADQNKIIEYIKYGDNNDHVLYFLISTGMRIGEVVALTWDDINMDTGEININKIGVNSHGSMHIEDRTKTPSSCRKIIVGKNIVEWLKYHRDSINQNDNWRNLVFPNRRMNITNPTNLLKYWERVCAILEIEYQGLHALRHTWATRAFESKIPVLTVSKMLGHKNVITTMNIYQDVLDVQKQDCADIMNELF